MAKNIWKFGYGSNISPEFARNKKSLNVLDYRRCVLKGWALSFPKDRAIQWVEPAFATMRQEAGAEIHGTCLLLPEEDAKRLDAQERAYNVEAHTCEIYPGDEAVEGAMTLTAEVYAPKRAEEEGNPQGPCSDRYRDILVNAAESVKLAPAWVDKLKALPTYEPSAETLALRSTLPIFEPKQGFPSMTIAELAKHDGKAEDLEKFPVYIGLGGYIWKHDPFFKVYWGRDYTFRVMLHRRGISLDRNDDCGVSPFPKLCEISEKEPIVLEYFLRQRDRVQHMAGEPIAVLKEFWDDQK